MAHDEIRAVLFDLGDTLLEFGPVNKTKAFLAGAKSTHAFLKDHGQPVSCFAWYFLRNLVRLRTKYLIANLTRKDFDSLQVLQKVGGGLGVKLSPEQWEQFAWLWYESLGHCARIEVDLARTLDTLKRMGLKLGIVSNTFVNRSSLERQLRELGLLDFFSVQVYSYELHVRKPSPEIFRIAADKIGERAQSVLFVGDRIDNDIRPALASGMRAALKEAYTNEGRKTPDTALRICRLAELPALIERINATQAPAASMQT
ncbi:MAG: HAD family hydrolase [Phycisphaerae bacterium]|nr:HAD family hydrolase [Phycisphaerae bacterium]